jgi:hypothetical protein
VPCSCIGRRLPRRGAAGLHHDPFDQATDHLACCPGFGARQLNIQLSHGVLINLLRIVDSRISICSGVTAASRTSLAAVVSSSLSRVMTAWQQADLTDKLVTASGAVAKAGSEWCV